jgi:hypothetical protein
MACSPEQGYLNGISSDSFLLLLLLNLITTVAKNVEKIALMAPLALTAVILATDSICCIFLLKLS